MRPFWLLYIVLTAMISGNGFAQDCNILSKANDINPDQFCSPVEVVTWIVTYVGVNDAGKLVEIYIDWDDGDTETLTASEDSISVFSVTANHTYASEEDKCNYHPQATLVVDGVECTSSIQEQIVTVWDDDDHNGGRVNASPNVYPICVGEGATMRFNDDTRFNCVPPQERDVPNTKTRWIQWVYGTRNTMTGAAVRVNGAEWVTEFEGPVIELTGPVTGSGEVSLPISVADDKLVGQEFEVELRYWNYCNPWPTHEPVTDRSVIRIVPKPDATIDPVDTLCLDEPNIIMTAATGGGTWTGEGIVNPSTGEFSPGIAGIGPHSISYLIVDGNSCTGYDTIEVVVRPGPVGAILPVDPFCIYDAPYDLEAATPLGNWSGTGVTDASTGIFDPAVAGLGWHSVNYETEPDANGCFGNDTMEIEVLEPPFAQFLTPDSAWCETDSNETYGRYLITGNENSLFDLVLELNGTLDTLHQISIGLDSIVLNNVPGLNLYNLVKVIEHHGNKSCDADLFDTIVMDVHPLPVMTLETEYDDFCSPVEVSFEAQEGAATYIWDFGDGKRNISPLNEVSYTYQFEVDTMREGQHTDTVYYIQLIAETEYACSDTINDSVRVYPNPIADFFVSPELQDYPDTVVYLLNLSSRGNWQYNWNYGDGGTHFTREPNQHSYNTWGVYDIELKIFSPYCRDSTTRQIQIMPPPPVSSFEPDSLGCPPLDITFKNSSKYADTFIWDFDDGSYSTDFEPEHRFWESKVHRVKLTAYGLSGVDTAYRTITIHERPTAMFGVYPPKARNLKQVFKFVNRSNNAGRYRWEFGDGTSSEEIHPAHIYPDSGRYTVTLYVWSPEGCPDTIVYDELIEIIAGEGSTEFPNAFIWNGSGPTGGHWTEGVIDNTVFHPHMVNPIDLKMMIYTRWGEMIWETNEVHVGWDGYLKNGELAQPGVYVYKAYVTYVDGMQELLTGDVTFLY